LAAAIGASLAGLATLAALTLAAGRLLATGVDIGWVQLVVTLPPEMPPV